GVGEESGRSVGVLEKDLSKPEGKGRMRKQDVFDVLRKASNSESYQIIFADPPYEKIKHGERYTETLLNNEALPRLLEPSGSFVLEKRPDETVAEMKLWRVVTKRTYGATEVLFFSQSAIK